MRLVSAMNADSLALFRRAALTGRHAGEPCSVWVSGCIHIGRTGLPLFIGTGFFVERASLARSQEQEMRKPERRRQQTISLGRKILESGTE